VNNNDSITRLLRPRAIAIVGVSAEAGSLGGAVLTNLKRFGYGGDIHLVSRNTREIDGRPCVASIADLPKGIDVAVLGLPGAGIRDAVAACVRREVGAALVFAAGFGETGKAGRAEQDAIAKVARDSGMALSGPNCIGLVNYRDGVPLTYEPLQPLPARDAPAVGIVAQSGAMLSSLRATLLGKGLALSHIVSTGNEAGLGAEDFLAFMVDDAETRAIVVFAEQLRRPRDFLALAARARELRKPIVLLHPGRSARAKDSARTHTGALAGDYAVMATLVRHHAVVLVDTIEELIDTADLLARFPPPRAGAAIITNSGAFKGFALDFCADIGLELAPPTQATLDAVRNVLPAFAAIDNPLDTTGQTIKDPTIFTHTARHFLADPNVGSLIVSVVPGGPQQAMAKVETLLPPFRATDKPVALALLGDEAALPRQFIPAFRDAGVPVFLTPERALRAMAHATAYGRQLASAAETSADIAVPPLAPRRGVVPEHEGKAILSKLGIAVPRGALAGDLATAKKIAADVGYPVVLKAQSADLGHKSDAGGVIGGIVDAAHLANAWDELHASVARAKPGLTLDGVLVEEMAAPGVEMVVGARRDPDWEPVTLVGLGGIFVEVLDDVRLMPADLSRARIADEIGKLKAASLLRGARGRPPADIDALADAVQRVGALMRAQSNIQEIDINPLVVYPHGVLALDVLLVAK
jgi:acyl-CoA synthetase (NDP forming)